MMNFKYYIPTRILFGTGSLQQLGDQELPGKKAMIEIGRASCRERVW